MIPEQIQRARRFMGWSQTDLANKTGLARSTIVRIENNDGPLFLFPDTEQAIKETFEAEGIKFVTTYDLIFPDR